MAKYQGKKYCKSELLDFCGNISSIAGASQFTYTGAYARDLRAYDVKNGDLRFTINIDKCMDIGELYFKGIPMHFLAKPGIINNTWWNDGPNANRSIMGGMFFTCGLSNVGPFQEINGQTLPQHGYIRNIPAEQYGDYSRWEKEDFIIDIRGTMREASLFGTNLVLRRRLTSKLGESCIHIHDEIENESQADNVPLMLMYHINAGFPLLGPNTKLIINPKNTRARDEISAEGGTKEKCTDFGPPETQCTEQVFYHQLEADGTHGQAHLHNPDLKLTMNISFDMRELPHLIHWKSKEAGNYVIGIEPANCYPEGILKEQKNGTLRYLKAYEKIETHMSLSFSSGEKLSRQ